MRLLLLVLPFAVAMDAIGDFNLGDTIKGLPGQMRGSLRQFRVGTKQMWVNSKAAGSVKKRVTACGIPLNYAELQLLRKSGEDTTKLLQAGVMWLVAPELIPAMLYFYPRALPSTFESTEGCAKRHATLCRLRASATLQLLAKLDEDSVARGKKGVRAKAQRQLAIQAGLSRQPPDNRPVHAQRPRRSTVWLCSAPPAPCNLAPRLTEPRPSCTIPHQTPHTSPPHQRNTSPPHHLTHHHLTTAHHHITTSPHHHMRRTYMVRRFHKLISGMPSYKLKFLHTSTCSHLTKR